MHGTPMQCVSMEGSMSCPCFLATSPNQTHTGEFYFFSLFVLSFTDKIFSCLFSSAAGCIMPVVMAQVMEYTLSSLLNPVLSMMEKNRTVAWCRDKVCNLVLCNA